MKAFEKISASRTKTNEKSVLVDDIWFNKEVIFTKADVEEVMEFVKNKFPYVLGGNTFYVNSFPHLFGNSKNISKKFMYVLSCLRNEEGKPLFILGDENGLVTIQIATVGVIDPGKDKKPNTPTKKSKTTNKELKDTLKDKFRVKELKEIAKSIKGVKSKEVNKLKESGLVKLIMEKKSKEEIAELLGV